MLPPPASSSWGPAETVMFVCGEVRKMARLSMAASGMAPDVSFPSEEILGDVSGMLCVGALGEVLTSMTMLVELPAWSAL